MSESFPTAETSMPFNSSNRDDVDVDAVNDVLREGEPGGLMTPRTLGFFYFFTCRHIRDLACDVISAAVVLFPLEMHVSFDLDKIFISLVNTVRLD